MSVLLNRMIAGYLEEAAEILRLHGAVSNTERAHRLGRSRDWVVLYAQDATHEHQYTVITSTHGAMRGRREVAGRERQCRSAERRAA